jgi:hypothetical protein
MRSQVVTAAVLIPFGVIMWAVFDDALAFVIALVVGFGGIGARWLRQRQERRRFVKPS